MDCDCCSRSVFVANVFEPNVCRNCRHEERTHQQTSNSLANSRDTLIAIQGNTGVEKQCTPQPKPRPRHRVPQSGPEPDSVVQVNNRTLALRSRLENEFKTTRTSPGEGAHLAREIMSSNVDGDVRSRYFCLDLRGIIDRNKPQGDSLSNDYLTMLSSAFDILEKYAVNLLKPNRPQYWRQIKYSNGVFQARVDCMKGAHDILKQMGYSEECPNCLSFPENMAEPDIETVSRVATDLLLARIEVDALLEGTHPYSESLKSLSPVSLPSHLSQQPAPMVQRPFQSHMDITQQPGIPPSYSWQGQAEVPFSRVKETVTGPADRPVPTARPVPKPRTLRSSVTSPTQFVNQPPLGQTHSVSPQTKPVQYFSDITRPPSNYQAVSEGLSQGLSQQQQKQSERIRYPPCHDEAPPSLDIYMSCNPIPQTQDGLALNKVKQPLALETDTKFCPNCEKAGNGNFCAECGCPLPETPVKTYGMLPKLCPECKIEIQPGAKFCSRCGIKIDLQASPTLQKQPTLSQTEQIKQKEQSQKPTESRGQIELVYKEQPPSATTTRPVALKAESEPAVSLDQWSCEYCTFLNDASRRICEVCSKTRSSVLPEVKPAPVSLQQSVQSTIEQQSTVVVEKKKSDDAAQDRQEMRLNLTEQRPPTVVAAAATRGSPHNKVSERQEGKFQELKDKGQLKVQHLKEIEEKAVIQGCDPNKLNKMDHVNATQAEASSKYDKDLSRERSPLSRQHKESTGYFRHLGSYGSNSQTDEGPPVMDDTMQQKSKYQHRPSRSDDPRSGYAATPADRAYPSSSGDQSRRMFEDDMERRQREMEKDRQRRQLEERQKEEEERLRKQEAERLKEETIKQNDRKFFSFLKEGETNGFSPEEVEVALTVAGDDAAGPVTWLVEQLPGVLDMVAELATKHGQKQYPRLGGLGTFGTEETRTYFLNHGGNYDETVKALCEARKEQTDELKQLGNFKHAYVCQHLSQAKGDVGKALVHLQAALLQPFVDRIWQEEEFSSGDEPEVDGLKKKLIPKSVKELAKSKEVGTERRAQVLLAEYGMKSWGRAELAVRLLDECDEQCSYGVADVVDAVQAYGDYEQAKRFLEQECQLCCDKYPRTKMMSLAVCQCSMCRNCLIHYFSIVISERAVKHMVCPMCNQPSMDDQQLADLHFQTLSGILHHLLDKDLYDMMQKKLNERSLMDDPNFRWCPHCLSGFLNDNVLQLKMICPNCGKGSCFDCKEKWAPQHDNATCEQFRQWKFDNDPDNQQRGLAAQLDQDGIDCPRCKFRYALSKGGCMHFKCTQCPHEFCSGCSQPFLKNCLRFEDCKARGLHAHHPRDCLFFLRDSNVQTLQNLLDTHEVKYNTAIPEVPVAQDEGNEAAAKPVLKCTVTEQKETQDGLQDEPCGRDCKEGFAGLCELHYKEYLVHLINVKNIDPVDIMGVGNITVVLTREKQQTPAKQVGESDDDYLARLRQHVKNEVPLQKRDRRGVLQWTG